MDEKSKIHFNTAKENLKGANEELFKPEEDVVSYLVCKNSQQAIENYLKGYLTLRGFETNENETLQSLLDRCKSLDSKFNQVDIETIDCKAHKMDSRYCQDVSKVSSCFDTADNLDTFLRKLKII
ncbi:MAG: HEPN domain-containing protein [Flavobacteriaceae bacterium]|nr:HEPN domain-containing protein [Flavobacteriaceae bacterium]